MQKKKASFLSALALTAGLFLSSCGAPSEATEFATVNYYDNAPMPSLVGVDYVVKGRATSYRGYTNAEGERVTYDFLDRSGVIPAVGTYRTFKEWDYGIYLPSEEVVLDSSSEEESIIGQRVDPKNILGDCDAHPVFENTYYNFSIVYKDGANFLRRPVSEEPDAKREIIGKEGITFLDLQKIAASNGSLTLDYPGKEAGDDLPKAPQKEGYVSEFLGYGSPLDLREKKGYALPEELGQELTVGEGDPTYANTHASGEFYVDEEYDPLNQKTGWPLWVYLDNGDQVQDDWIKLGDLGSEGQFVFETVYTEPERARYDLTYTLPGQTEAKTVNEVIPYAYPLKAVFSPESTSGEEEVTVSFYVTDGNNQEALIHEDTFTSTLQETGHHFVYSLEVDPSSNQTDLNSVRGPISVLVKATSELDTLKIDVHGATDVVTHEVTYGGTYVPAAPAAPAGQTFVSFAVLEADGSYRYIDDPYFTNIVRDLEVYAVYADLSYVAEVGTDKVTYSYDNAKGNYAISNVEILSGATSITEDYFLANIPTNLEGLTLPVTRLGGAFASLKSSVTSIVVPSYVTSFVTSTFQGFTTLEDVTFKGPIAEIANNAFENNAALVSVDFQGNAGVNMKIGNTAFRNCPSLTAVKGIEDNATLSLGYRVFNACPKLVEGLETFVLPGGEAVTYIGTNCFDGSGLTYVPFMGSVPSDATIQGYAENWNLNGMDLLNAQALS